MATENLEINIGANTQDLQNGLNQASQSVTNFGTQIAKVTKPTGDATQSLINLSRIAQDAPYGFMGIANNLNPMLESFQRLQKETGSATSALSAMISGMMGPAGLGLALGVVSSLVVAFSSNLHGHASAADEAKKAQDDFTKSLDDASKKAAEQASNLNTLIQIAQSANATDQQRASALNSVKEALSKVNKDYASHIQTVGDAEEAVKQYTKALIQQAIVQRFQNELADKSVDLAKTQLSLEQSQANLQKTRTELPQSSGIGASMELQAVSNEDKLGYATKSVNDQIEKQNVLLKERKDLQTNLDRAIEQGIKMPLFTDLVSNTSGAKVKSAPKEKDYSLQDHIAELEHDTQETKKWADEQMKIHEKMLEFYKKYGDVIKAETSASQMRDTLAKQDKERQKKEEATPFSERKMATDLPEWAKKQEDTIKNYENKLKQAQKTSKDFAQTLSQDVTQGIMTMWDAMDQGKNPLMALGDYLGQLVKQFAAAIIQATIFKGLMSLFSVATGGGAGFFGSLLGGVGKLLGMADGGIVSRPTLAMVGEGGQSEAVMPLNKLSNMMNSTFNAGAMSGMGGGGNGQFVLKGNDLVLALQRSNYSLNLRRGNGI
jgi:hypothetical protein